MNERDENVGPFVEIRSIAEAIQEHVPDPLSSIVRSLCEPAMDHCRTPLVGTEQEAPSAARGRDHGKVELLSAAVHLNLMGLVKILLSQGSCPFLENRVFKEPVCVAVSLSNLAMLQVFEDHTCEHCVTLRSTYRLGNHAVVTAAETGDMDNLRFVLRSATEKDESAMTPRINRATFCEIVEPLTIGWHQTPNPAVFEHLKLSYSHASESLVEPSDSDSSDGLGQSETSIGQSGIHLLDQAGLGQVDMVRHLLGAGAGLYANIMDSPKHRRYALSEACRYDQPDVVDLLLEHGADPGFPYPGFFPDRRDRDKNQFFIARPLTCAVRSGNKTTVAKLLGRGAEVEDAAFGAGKHLPGLVWAVLREDEPMLRLLLAAGASFDSLVNPKRSPLTVGDVALAFAVQRGLESMVQFMGSLGYVEVRIDPSKNIRRQYT